jgi:WD40 repeat protein
LEGFERVGKGRFTMSEFSQDFAVLVGIDQYGGGIGSLQTAVNDVTALSQRLQQDHHYQVMQLINQQATLSGLQHLLTDVLPRQVQPDSRLLFYFAGHGIALNGDDGPEGYLIPQDARVGDTHSYLSMLRLQTALSELPCRHFLGILDCCFAGAFRWSSTRDIAQIPEVIYQERYDRFIQDAAWQIITSAAYDQQALDSLTINSARGQVGAHSPFAAALLEALSGQADIYPAAKAGQPTGDGVTTATELYLYLRDRVEVATIEHRQRQTPGLWPLKQHDKGEYIFLTPDHPLNLPPAPALDKLQNPYRGLAAFEASHSDLFFGREALTQKLFEQVVKAPLSVVLGASGSGKSSLVKAGLMAKIQQAETCEGWYVLPPLRLGELPLQALDHALAQDPLFMGSAGEDGAFDPIGESRLLDYLAHWQLHYPYRKLLMVIDQFEELMTLGTGRDERSQCLTVLANAIAHYSAQLKLVLTLRSDFEPQFQTTALSPYWQAARFLVPPMSRTALREAIIQPASKRVIYFQSDDEKHALVDQLINEVADMPGALPLLSFTLSELYLRYLERQEIAKAQGRLLERTITEADYRALGGVARSLTQRADSEYQALIKRDPRYATTVRNVMLRMVATGGGQLSRRRVPLSEFEYLSAENNRVQTVIQHFSAARLLVEGTGSDGRAYVEPAHDALVNGWQRLLTWQQAEEADLILQRRLTPAAEEWRSHQTPSVPTNLRASATHLLSGLDRGLLSVESGVAQRANALGNLWKGTRRGLGRADWGARSQPAAKQFLWHGNPYLDVLKAELDAPNNRLNKLETDFVRASLLLKRKNISWRWRLAIAIIIGLSGLTLATVVSRRADMISDVESSRAAAEANFLAGNQLDGFTQSLDAAQVLQKPLLRAFKPPEPMRSSVRGTLQKGVYAAKEHNRFEAHQGTTRSSVSADGRTVVSGGDDDIVIVWNWQGDKQAEWSSGQEKVSNLRLSPDGKQLATAGVDHTVRLWNLQGQLLAEFRGHTDAIKGLAFSPDGQFLATASSDQTVRLWSLKEYSQYRSQVAQPQPLAVLRGHRGEVWSVTFSPNGQQLASGATDGVLRLWNLQGQILKQFQAQQGELHQVQFSPDGRQMVSAGQDGRLRLWRLNGDAVADLVGHQGRVWDAKFSADGQQIASTSGDGTVRLWSAMTGAALAVLSSHQGPVRNVSFSEDGQRMVTSGDDGSVRLWRLRGEQIIVFNPFELAEKSYQKTGQRNGYEAPQTGQRDGYKALQPALTATIALGTNGQDVVTANQKTVRLWHGSSEPISRWQEPAAVSAIALGQKREKLAIAQGSVLRLKTLQGKLLAEDKESFTAVVGLDMSPDENFLVSARENGLVRLWNLEENTVVEWKTNTEDLKTVTLSPSAEQVATAGADGIIRLWNRQGKLLAQMEGHLGEVHGIAFSSDGQRLASTGQDGTVRLWDIVSARQQALFQVYESEVNAVAFSADGRLLVTGDTAGNVQLWDTKRQAAFAEWQAHPGTAVGKVSFSETGILTLGQDGSAYRWAIEDINVLRSRGCKLIGDYLRHVEEKDTACQGY